VERVKALLGSKGKKLRKLDRIFVAEGVQWLRAYLTGSGDEIELLQVYLTQSALERYGTEFAAVLDQTLLITDAIAIAMSEDGASQGVVTLCRYKDRTLHHLKGGRQFAYFWQLQDPGNAGTIIRTADACGLDGVIFSPGSVDLFSAKVVRSTAGSLINLPVVMDVEIAALQEFAAEIKAPVLAFDGNGTVTIGQVAPAERFIAMYGNEARGLPPLPDEISIISLPMAGAAESLNVASAAAISQYLLTGLAAKKVESGNYE
jgi:TrmH family RNA methyltransferase